MVCSLYLLVTHNLELQTAESASSGEASHGSITDIYVSVSPIDGLTIGAGHAENTSTDTSTTSEDTQEW